MTFQMTSVQIRTGVVFHLLLRYNYAKSSMVSFMLTRCININFHVTELNKQEQKSHKNNIANILTIIYYILA